MPANPPTREGFKTIEVGTFKDTLSISNAINHAGFVISPFAYDLLRKTKLSPSKKSLEIVLVSLHELGLAPGKLYPELCKAAGRLNLQLCPAEVGPQLRLQYKNQPADEGIYIVMDALQFPDGLLGIYVVNNSFDGQRLGTLLTDDFCQDNFKYAFVRS